MRFPKKMSSRVYIYITLIITVSLFLFSYLYAVETKENFYNTKELELLQISISLGEHFNGLFANLDENFIDNEEEKINKFKKNLEVTVEILEKRYPNYGFGYYCFDNSQFIMAGIEIESDFVEYDKEYFKLDSDDLRYRLTQYDKSNDWVGEPILYLAYPVFYNDEMVGYAWAFTKTKDLNHEIYTHLINYLIYAALIWLIVTIIIGRLFHKFSIGLEKLSDHIQNEDDEKTNLETFPELLPMLSIVTNFRDKITHQKNVLLQMIEQVPGAFLSIDKNKVITLANKEAFRLLDCNNLIGQSLEEFTKQKAINMNQPYILNSLESKNIYTKERIKIGNSIFQLDSSPIIEPSTNEVIGAVGYFFDVTEEELESKKTQKLLEQYFHQSKNLQQLINAIPTAFLAIDNNTKIIAINERLINLFSTEHPSEYIGKNLSFVTDKLNISYEDFLIYRALRGEELTNEPLNLLRHSLLVNGYPIKDRNKKIIGAIAIYQDITELEILRNEITNMERLNLVGQMAASITHEIRNPMATIRGFIQLLSESANRGQKEYFQIIINELDRANNIINDFLSLSQNRLIEMESYNLNDIIKELYPIMMADSNIKGQYLELLCDERIPDIAMNKKEIKQLILNLTRNGTEAMGQGGKLTISTKYLNNRNIQLLISDNGCGIPKNKVNQIFDPFFTTKENGTGLGLSVSKSIVEKHRGIIEINSVENEGTTFIITFNT